MRRLSAATLKELPEDVPRPRYDQFMAWGWKVLLPLTLLNIVVTGALVLANQ